MVVIQNRIYASSAGEAAIKIRDMYGNGKLTLKHIYGGWYEYTVVIEDAEKSEKAMRLSRLSGAG